MKRMLINATQKEELRVAIVDGQQLIDLDIEGADNQQKKSNIYKGKITRVEPSLDAAFVDYGAERHGFLPLKEVSREYFLTNPDQGSRINIKQVLKEGQEIVVQIDKDERGNKGAALTTFISLAGRFMVLMPNNPRGGGVSRRIAGEERDEIRATLKEIDVPDGMSVIVRTAGIGRTAEELNWDLDYLKGVWSAILKVVVSKPSPFLIFQDNSPVVRALRDHLNSDIGEIIVDDDATMAEGREFMEHAMPHNIRKLQRYEEPVPLFTRFQIESQIESAFSHSVSLPSGGSLVIDPTEALVSIDINSARATKGDDIEATAFQTNLEAADEIARQCRLRDLGGLLVIDFIDMGPSRNQREVENRLRDAMRGDRARVQIGKISRFGLLEMSRQRMRRSLDESAHQVCPRCSGAGTIRSVESLALSILRLVGEESRKDMTSKVITELPVEVATYLLNEKRDWIMDIEKRDKVQLLLVANSNLETPHYTIRRVRNDQTEDTENTGASYNMTTPEQNLTEAVLETSAKNVHEAPAVAVARPATQAPAPAPQAKPVETAPKLGLFGWIKQLFFGDGTAEPKKPSRKTNESAANPRSRTKTRNRKPGSQEGRSGSRRNDNKTRDGSNKQRDGRKGKSQNKDTDNNANDQAATKAADSQKNSGPETSQGGGQQSNEDGNENRKRRNRRRRRRGGNRDKSPDDAAQSANQQDDGAQTSSANKDSDNDSSADNSNTSNNSRRGQNRQSGGSSSDNASPENQASAHQNNSAGSQSNANNSAPSAPQTAAATPVTDASAKPGPVHNPITAQNAPIPPARPLTPPIAAATPAPAAAPQPPVSASAQSVSTTPAAAEAKPVAAPASPKPAAPVPNAPTAAPGSAPATEKPAAPSSPPAAEKPAASAPQAATPRQDAPAPQSAKPPAAPSAPAADQADKQRKLPWETSAPEAPKTQTVWSSEGDTPKGRDER